MLLSDFGGDLNGALKISCVVSARACPKTHCAASKPYFSRISVAAKRRSRFGDQLSTPARAAPFSPIFRTRRNSIDRCGFGLRVLDVPRRGRVATERGAIFAQVVFRAKIRAKRRAAKKDKRRAFRICRQDTEFKRFRWIFRSSTGKRAALAEQSGGKLENARNRH